MWSLITHNRFGNLPSLPVPIFLVVGVEGEASNQNYMRTPRGCDSYTIGTDMKIIMPSCSHE